MDQHRGRTRCHCVASAPQLCDASATMQKNAKVGKASPKASDRQSWLSSSDTLTCLKLGWAEQAHAHCKCRVKLDMPGGLPMAVALFNRHKALSQPQAPNRCFTASRMNQCQQEQKQLRALLDASAHAAMALVYSLASGLMLRRDAETLCKIERKCFEPHRRCCASLSKEAPRSLHAIKRIHCRGNQASDASLRAPSARSHSSAWHTKGKPRRRIKTQFALPTCRAAAIKWL